MTNPPQKRKKTRCCEVVIEIAFWRNNKFQTFKIQVCLQDGYPCF